MATTKTGPESSLRVSRTFPARREEVFRAWTDPKALTRWFCPEGYVPVKMEVDLRPGGRWLFELTRLADNVPVRIHGTYQEVKPPERLVYTWDGDWDPEMKETLVTVEFRESGGATEIHLTHERFVTARLRGEHLEGWNGCFDRVGRYLSGK